MRRSILLLFICLCAVQSYAQKTSREELEKQKEQYKKEMQDLDKLVKENKSQTNQTFAVVKLQANKIALQEKVINNISRDINILDDNIYTLQKDVNRYDKILDTLKQEYAKSMVYAYKNRSNYDFLNFVFSASSFNDAIKRVAYLKSYREYREMQGENILRTQELRRKRIEEITGVKQSKNKVLESKSVEVSSLEKEKQEQDKRLAELQKNGKQIANLYAAKKKQMQAVSDLAKKLLREEMKKQKEEAARLAAVEKARLKAIADAAKNNKTNNPTTTTNPTVKTKTTTPKEPKVAPVKTELPQATVTATTNFVNSKGSLPWPVNSGYLLLHYGPNKLGDGGTTLIVFDGISIGTDVSSPVKCVFDGFVSAVQSLDGDAMFVLVRHGEYMTSYSNIGGVTVKTGQQVSAGQVLGKVLRNLDGVGAVDFMISNDKGEKDPEQWLRRK